MNAEDQTGSKRAGDDLDPKPLQGPLGTYGVCLFSGARIT